MYRKGLLSLTCAQPIKVYKLNIYVIIDYSVVYNSKKFKVTDTHVF